MKTNLKLISLLLIITWASTNLSAQDWPQFLGPERNCISPQKNLLRSWPESGPEVLWKVPVGIGYGGPIVKDGKIYILDRDDKVGDIMRCFELNSGEELWKFAYDAPGSFPFPGSRSIPILDGDYVYSCGAIGDLYCIDINTHQPVWHKNVWKDFGGGNLPTWAITQNPLVYGDMLITAAQTSSTGVVAYDKLTGEVKWTTESKGATGYASPELVTIAGEKQIVMVSAGTGDNGRVYGIDPNTGNILWEYANFQCRIPSTGVMDIGNDKVFVTGGYNAGSAMLKIVKNVDGSYQVNELYTTPDFGVHTLPPVLYDGYFYGQYSTNERRDGLVCMSLDGEIKWATKRSPQFNKGSLILADGLMLATDGFKTLYLLDPNPDEFKVISSAEMLNQGGVDNSNGMTNFGGPTQNWAPMALAEGKLLIRDQGTMYCLKVAE